MSDATDPEREARDDAGDESDIDAGGFGVVGLLVENEMLAIGQEEGPAVRRLVA